VAGAQRASHRSTHLYLLTTCLFYPAVLGVVFYESLGACAGIAQEAGVPTLLLAYVAVLTTFSVDFLYSVASKTYYGVSLFVADLVILLLLFVGYRGLLAALCGSGSPSPFFASYALIHFVFLLWDALLARGLPRRAQILIYDACGLAASLAGFFFFRSSVAAALGLLWLCTVLYLVIAWPRIRALLEEG